jgi:hypothetical protein
MRYIILTCSAQRQKIPVKAFCLPLFEQLPAGFETQYKHKQPQPRQVFQIVCALFPNSAIRYLADPPVQDITRKKMIDT